MKLQWTMLCLVLMGAQIASQANAEETAALKTQKDMLSYSIGVSVAKNFKKQEADVDLDLMIKGLKDGLSGARLLMTEKDMRKVMNMYQSEVRQKALFAKRVAIEENKKKGEAFLATNKTKDGVMTLPSGVQYKILKAGDGKKPIESDLVEVHYRGTILDGTEFDGTEAGLPATLKVSALIAGWKEALKLMPAGSKWQIFIPPQFAYGERGVGSDIGPNETLVFELELLAVK